MSNSIEITELKKRLTQVLKEVAGQGQTFEITDNGQPVARLIPVKPETTSASEAAWRRLKELSQQIGKSWTGPGAVETVREIRRDLD